MTAVCAIYSPSRTWNEGPGSRVGVVGLGGLGHMSVKLAHATSAHETVMSRSESEWINKVYRPDIAPWMDRLYKKPSYDPF